MQCNEFQRQHYKHYERNIFDCFFTLLPAHHFRECFHVETGKQTIHKKEREKTMMS